MKHANDNHSARAVSNWPTMERLARFGQKERAEALIRYRDLFGYETPANDNDRTPLKPWESRPTVFELLAAAGRTSVKTTRSGRTVRSGNGLRFDTKGHLVEWQSSDGKWRLPRDETKRMNGRPRDQRDLRAYLAMPGVPVDRRAIPVADEGFTNCEAPLHKVFLRLELEAHGVDGGVSFHEARSRAGLPDGARGATEIARGAMFLGGVCEPRPKARIQKLEQTADPDFLERSHILRRLSSAARSVLELAITNASAKDVGVKFGYRGKYAERRGVGLIDEALQEFSQLIAA